MLVGYKVKLQSKEYPELGSINLEINGLGKDERTARIDAMRQIRTFRRKLHYTMEKAWVVKKGR